MSAGPITPEEEARYKLAPLPDVEPVTPERAAELNRAYEISRGSMIPTDQMGHQRGKDWAE